MAVQGRCQVLTGPQVVRAQQSLPRAWSGVGDAPVAVFLQGASLPLEDLDHAVGLWVAPRRQAVLDAQFLAPAIELMRSGRCPRAAPE